jgi:uncharacterized protein (UPF0297 family)
MENRDMTDEHKKMINETLQLVYDALDEKGYEPICQIMGYLLSEDPTYISNNRDARNLIRKYDRDDLMEDRIAIENTFEKTRYILV